MCSLKSRQGEHWVLELTESEGGAREVAGHFLTVRYEDEGNGAGWLGRKWCPEEHSSALESGWSRGLSSLPMPYRLCSCRADLLLHVMGNIAPIS